MNRTLHVLFEIQILSSPHGYVRSSIYLLHDTTKSGRLWHQSSYEEARGSLSTSCICYNERPIVPTVIRFWVRFRTRWVRITQHFLEGRQGRGRGSWYFTFVDKLSSGVGGTRKNILGKNYDLHSPPSNPWINEWPLSDHPLSQPH